LVAVRLISYVPAAKLNVGFGEPDPKFVQPTEAFLYPHDLETGVLVDVSVKVTESGPVPTVEVFVKLASGAGAVPTVI
jgi:hypothetical protein